MKDIYADRIGEKLSSIVPGWLVDKFTGASDAPYQLDLLALRRKAWREANANYVLHNEKVGELWHPPEFVPLQTTAGNVYVPNLKAPQLHGYVKRQLPEEFLEAVSIATSLLPESMRVLSAEQGMRLKLGRIMTDIDPSYKTLRCRGQNGMVVNTSGVYEGRRQFVAVTQGYISLETGKFIADTFEGTIDGVLHEFGHNFESFVFNTMIASNSWRFRAEPHQRDFFRAYRQDVEDLKGATASGKYDLTYYLTKNNGGTQEHQGAACSETLAQLFAERHADLILILQRTFPRCTEVMDRMLDAVDGLVKVDPSYGHISLERG